LDRHLADARLLHDAHELADSLRTSLADAVELVRLSARSAADAEQQPLGVVPEQAEQEKLFLARGDALGVRPDLAQPRDDVLLALGIGRQLDGPSNRRVDRAGRRAEASRDERAELVDDRQVAARGE